MAASVAASVATALSALSVLPLALLGGCLTSGEPGNHQPEIDSLRADPSWVLPDSTARLIASASDRDGDRLLFRWTAAAGTLLSGADRDTALWRAPTTAGACTLSVLVSDGEDLAWGSVAIPVVDPDPELELEPHAIRFPAGVACATLLIRNPGTGTLVWSLAADVSWLRPSVTAGATTGETDTVVVAADRYGLVAGEHEGSLAISANAGMDTVSVSLTVTAVPVYGYTVVNVFPHDPNAFTQGLVYKNGLFYEGTGRHGESTLREVEPATGHVLRRRDLDERYFGEGVALLGESILQLTLSHHVGFIYDQATFELQGQFGYPMDGWGLTCDGSSLILSDGTDRLFFLDPQSFALVDTLYVRDLDQPVRALNELEYIHGEIYANVWGGDWIVRISPHRGEVVGRIDLTGLLAHGGREVLAGPPSSQTPELPTANVLNGIAYDEANDRLFVTGKYWPSLFEITLVAPGDGTAQ